MDAEGLELPSAKRPRLGNGESTRQQRPTGSRLFAPYRTIGLVSPTPVPFTSVPLGKSTFQITTSVGSSLQTYDLRRGLQLVFLSRPPCPASITATYAYRDRLFAAWGGSTAKDSGIWVFQRGLVVGELEVLPGQIQDQILQIVVFGGWIVACTTNAVHVWKAETYEHYTTIRPPSAGGKIFTGCICTLPTLLNKIFVACQDGSVEIYNVSTAKLVHTLQAPSTSSGPVTALEQASAICILAVAYADGSLHLFDVDTDESILSFLNKSGKAITSITFRMDGAGAGKDGRKDGIMATASVESGDITYWDLNQGGKLAGVVRNAHEILSSGRASGITKIEFLPGQPLIVSSGLDNAVRTWVFDNSPFSPIPRRLHERSGHAAPVTDLMFVPTPSDGSDAAGKWLLSAGQDRSLWGFSLRKDGQNTELSQGNVKHKAKKVGQLSDHRSAVEDLKVPPIIDMACCLNRDGGMGAVGGAVWSNTRSATAEESSMTGWESVLTAHVDDKIARTWSWGRKRAGRWAFETSDHRPVTSVAMTACGTFALLGSSKGSIDMFNLQSGLQRQRFPPKMKPAQAKELKLRPDEAEEILESYRGHKNGITGLIVDASNQHLVSSSLDGSIIFWDFSTGKILHRLHLPSTSALSLKYNPVSNLVALSCDDLCIRVLDIASRRLVRELWGCVGQINDICFSHDGRWIASCSMDSVIRIFDLATGHLIDAFRMSPTCTNLAFSSTGEHLATTHAGTLGITIWTNKSLYTHISTRQIDEETGIIDLTSSTSLQPTSPFLPTDPNESSLIPSSYTQDSTISTPTQLSTSLLTLSLTPRARWQTLLNLETIRARNKPIQPPEKPKSAPFFLDSSLAIHSPTPQAQDKQAEQQQKSRISTLQSSSELSSTTSDIQPYLSTPLPTNPTDTHPLIAHLTPLAPSATHLLLTTLPLSSLVPFIRILTHHLRLTHRDYELINTWISVLLKAHSEFINSVPEIRDALVQFNEVNKKEGERLDRMVGYASGVLGGWLRSPR